MEHERDGDTNSSWCTRTVLQRLGKETGENGDQRKNRDNSDYSAVEID